MCRRLEEDHNVSLKQSTNARRENAINVDFGRCGDSQKVDFVELVKSIFLLSSELEFQLIHIIFASVSLTASTNFYLLTSYTTHELLSQSDLW